MVNKQYPYQTVDSGLFYKKVIDSLKKNQNIQFLKDIMFKLGISKNQIGLIIILYSALTSIIYFSKSCSFILFA